MKASPIRTSSAPVQASLVLGSLKVSLSDQESVTGILFTGKNGRLSTKASLHLEIRDKKDHVCRSIRRAMSESDVVRSVIKASGRFSGWSKTGSRSIPARIPEEEYLSEEDASGGGSLVLDCEKPPGVWPACDFPPVELGISGGGAGNGKKIVGGDGGGRGDGDGNGVLSGGNADQSKIGDYYKEMLKADPGNPLLLRNYGKFLHEVENDAEKAEEYYGRAILASPGDGEVLSLYGKLIWETQRDGSRAEAYFDQAIQASPNDCFLMGSYANFLWDLEEEDDGRSDNEAKMSSPALVEAF